MPNSTGATTTYDVTGLANGVAYTLQVRAENATGYGPPSAELSASTAPAKPASLSASVSGTTVTLSWAKKTGDTTIASWEYRQREETSAWGSWTAVPSSTGSTATYTISTGLTNGKRYSYQVRGVNAAGGGAASDVAFAHSAPAAPANVVAEPGNALVSLAWDDPSDLSLTGYEYRQKEGTNAWGNWTPIANSTSSTIQFVASGLRNGTEYTFEVRAVNSAGKGVASDEAKATPQPAPAMPANASASAVNADSATVTWTYPPASEALIAKFQARYREGNGDWSDWTDVAKTARTWTVTDGSNSVTLSRGKVYTFEVRSVNNQAVNSPGARAATATAPAKPTGVAAAPGFRQVTLSWNNPVYPSITRYEYRYKPASSGNTGYTGWTAASGSRASTTSHAVTGLTTSTAYTFELRAVNAAGDGEASDEVTATPPPRPSEPTGLTLTETFVRDTVTDRANDHFTLALAWTDPDDDTIVGWQYREAASESGLSAAAWTDVPGSDKDTTSYTLPERYTDPVVYVQLRGVNAAGFGQETPARSVTLVPAKPDATASQVFSGPSFTLTLAWSRLQRNGANDASIRYYEFRGVDTGLHATDAQLTAALAAAEWKVVAGSGDATVSISIGAANPRYALQVRAVSVAGSGPASDARFFTLTPATPTGFAVVHREPDTNSQDGPRNGGTAQITWTASSDSSLTHYEYRRQASEPWRRISCHEPCTPAALAAHDVTLAAGEVYALQVRSGNIAAPSAPTTPFKITTVPDVPRSFVSIPTTERGQVYLNWARPPSGAVITKWQYRQRVVPDDWDAWQDIPDSGITKGATTWSYTVGKDAPLTEGINYGFQLRAVNAAGTGKHSGAALYWTRSLSLKERHADRPHRQPRPRGRRERDLPDIHVRRAHGPRDGLHRLLQPVHHGLACRVDLHAAELRHAADRHRHLARRQQRGRHHQSHGGQRRHRLQRHPDGHGQRPRKAARAGRGRRERLRAPPRHALRLRRRLRRPVARLRQEQHDLLECRAQPAALLRLASDQRAGRHPLRGRRGEHDLHRARGLRRGHARVRAHRAQRRAPLRRGHRHRHRPQ